MPGCSLITLNFYKDGDSGLNGNMVYEFNDDVFLTICAFIVHS